MTSKFLRDGKTVTDTLIRRVGYNPQQLANEAFEIFSNLMDTLLSTKEDAFKICSIEYDVVSSDFNKYVKVETRKYVYIYRITNLEYFD